MKNRIAIRSLCGLALLGALAFLSGCATGPEIKYEADPAVTLTEFKTYAIVPFSKTGGIQGADPGASLKYAPVITSSLKDALSAKGFTEAATPTEADFAVNVRASIVPKTDITDWGMGYAGYGGRYGTYWGTGMGYNTTIDQYNEGTLRVEIFNMKSKELAWVGWAKDEVYKAPDDAQIRKAITAILANFPVPQAKK